MKSSVRHKKRKLRKSAKVVLFLAICSLLCGFWLLIQNDEHPSDHEPLQSTQQTQNQDENKITVLNFPVVLEDTKLEIESLFPFSGINPDADCMQGEDIAAIVLTNNSDKELQNAMITLVLEDGTELDFMIEYIPSGRKVMAFSIDHLTLSDDAECVDVQVNATFSETESMDQILVETNGMNIQITNSSDSLNQLTVYYHDVFDDIYFGGKVYHETIDELSAEMMTEITASQSMMGVIEVVRISASK